MTGPSSQQETLTSQRLIGGRYRLGRVIGRGSMGVVWLAYDEQRIGYHIRLGIIQTPMLAEVLQAGRLLTLLNREAVSARRGLIVSGAPRARLLTKAVAEAEAASAAARRRVMGLVGIGLLACGLLDAVGARHRLVLPLDDEEAQRRLASIGQFVPGDRWTVQQGIGADIDLPRALFVLDLRLAAAQHVAGVSGMGVARVN